MVLSQVKINVAWLVLCLCWIACYIFFRDHFFLHVPSQWETMLQCDVVFYWLGAYIKWSLFLNTVFLYAVFHFAEIKFRSLTCSFIYWVHDVTRKLICGACISNYMTLITGSVVTIPCPWCTLFSIVSTYLFNSLWPSEAMLWDWSGSTVIQVMACCLTAPSHYLNQCWLEIIDIHLSAISQKMIWMCCQIFCLFFKEILCIHRGTMS